MAFTLLLTNVLINKLSKWLDPDYPAKLSKWLDPEDTSICQNKLILSIDLIIRIFFLQFLFGTCFERAYSVANNSKNKFRYLLAEMVIYQLLQLRNTKIDSDMSQPWT